METKNRLVQNIIASLSAVILWQLTAMLFHDNFLIASPLDVLKVLPTLFADTGFYLSLWYSVSRILGGFLLGVILGFLLGWISARYKFFEIILSPYMATVKSVPVASFVIIALLWLSSSNLSVFISFLIVLPVVYSNVLKGLQATDRKMLEMADAFKLGFSKRFIYIYLPQVKPYLISACSTACGLAWKSGVAAEIIGIPDGSVGEALYYSKVYLDTPSLFAWTLVIVLLSVGFEKLFTILLKLTFRQVTKL